MKKLIIKSLKGTILRLVVKILEKNKQHIIDDINTKIDIPKLNEKQERILFNICLDWAINAIKAI